MGRGKKATGVVEQGAHAGAGIFDQAAQGRPGALVNIFKASRNGDGIDGKLSPDRVPLGSVFDEPRRLDVSTLSRMDRSSAATSPACGSTPDPAPRR